MMTEPDSTASSRIMARLRDPEHGCEWDRAQTFATIAPYTIEEAYEVADAIARGDMAELRDELGDLLLQVVFHARIAEEAGQFAFDDVARAIADKLEARHPHMFGDAPPPGEARDARWEALKAAERAAKGATSALDGVARGAAGAAARREAAEARRAGWVRLARHRRARRQARRGNGRTGRSAADAERAGGSRRPAVRRGQPGARLRHRAGRRAARRQRQVRAALSGDGGRWRTGQSSPSLVARASRKRCGRQVKARGTPSSA